jgi:hypothetical protein
MNPQTLAQERPTTELEVNVSLPHKQEVTTILTGLVDVALLS